MTYYFFEFFSVAFIYFLVILSPGTAWALTIRNIFKYTRRTVVYSSIGLGLGISVAVAISLLGTNLLISQSGVFFSILKYVGAGYIAYIGYKSLTDKIQIYNGGKIIRSKDPSMVNAIKMGFITNATNVNAYLFLLSLFTLVVRRTTPLSIKVIYGAEMALAEFICFAVIGTILTHKFVKQRVSKFQIIIERFMGIVLIVLAIKIAFF